MSEQQSSGMMVKIGWVVSILPSLLLIFSAFMKVTTTPSAADLERTGWKAEQSMTLAIIEIACVIIYLFPKTSVLGAILATGYLGGAVATHVRIGDALFFIPIIVGVLIWLGIWLRYGNLRELIPIKN